MSSLLSATAVDIIKEAMSIMRVSDAETPLEASDQATGIRRLNYMIKAWQSKGFHLWTETEGVLPLVKSQRKYELGAGGNKAFRADSFYSTTLSALPVSKDITLNSVDNLNEAPNLYTFDPTSTTQDWVTSNATLSTGLTVTNTAANGYAEYPLETTPNNEYIATIQVNLDSASGVLFAAYDIDGQVAEVSSSSSGEVQVRFTARQKVTQLRITVSDGIGASVTLTNLEAIDTSTGDEIGVLLADNTIQWSYVNFVSGSVATLRDDVGTSAIGNIVYYSGVPIDRPLSLINARYQSAINDSEIPCNEWSRTDYFEQPSKDSQGIISNWYYSPQLELGDLYVWQVASDNTSLLNFTYIRPTDITLDNADKPDFPSEWFLPLAYNLAASLAPDYSVSDKKVALIETKAREMLDDALGYDNEDTYLRVEVSRRW